MTSKQSLQTTHPQVAATWHPTLNGDLTPADITHGSRTVCWWTCRLGHSSQRNVKLQAIGKMTCPVCDRRELLKGFNDVDTLFPHLTEFWHPTKNTYNSGDTIAVLQNRFWYLCEKGHETSCRLTNYREEFICKVCSGQEVLSGFNDLATTNPELLKLWHPTKNLNLTPTRVSKGSHKRAIWICEEGHEWSAMIYGVFGCPECSRQKSSESSTIKLKEFWNQSKNNKTIEEVKYQDKHLYYWQCKEGH